MRQLSWLNGGIYRKDDRINGHEVQDGRSNDVKKDIFSHRLAPIAGPALVLSTIGHRSLFDLQVEREISSEVLSLVNEDGHVAEQSESRIDWMAVFKPL